MPRTAFALIVDGAIAATVPAAQAATRAGKTGPAPGLTSLSRARFFKHVSGAQRATKWSIESFQVGGGQFDPGPPQDGALRVHGWGLAQPNRKRARHLTQVELKKSGGDCAKVDGEAFA